MKNIKIRDYINLLEKIEKEYGNIEVVENEYFETKDNEFDDTFVQAMIPTVTKNKKNENIVVIASHDVG